MTLNKQLDRFVNGVMAMLFVRSVTPAQWSQMPHAERLKFTENNGDCDLLPLAEPEQFVRRAVGRVDEAVADVVRA